MSQSLAKKNTKSITNLINSYFDVLLLKEGNNNNNNDEIMKAFVTIRDIASDLKDDEKKQAFNVISERLNELSKTTTDSSLLDFIEEFSYDLLIELMGDFDNYTYEDAYDLGQDQNHEFKYEYESESWEFSSF
jgi:hypothetical protein